MGANYLSGDDYKLVTESVPIICVDTIPVIEREGRFVPGMIIRATGSQKGKLTILGGRIYHSETIEQAIKRHLETDLGVTDFTYYNGLSAEHPFHVQQYLMQDSIQSDYYGFDPTKHALALTYLLHVNEAHINPREEASGIVWVSEKITDMSSTGFNQGVVINKALDFLANN